MLEDEDAVLMPILPGILEIVLEDGDGRVEFTIEVETVYARGVELGIGRSGRKCRLGFGRGSGLGRRFGPGCVDCEQQNGQANRDQAIGAPGSQTRAEFETVQIHMRVFLYARTIGGNHFGSEILVSGDGFNDWMQR